jgi:23S rRNA 5-hydroxycytidine C2501 synthase
VANGAARNVAVDFAVKESEKGFSVLAKDEDENIAEMEFEIKKSLAQKPEMVEINWKQQFSKLGDTVFYARNFSFDFKKPYFIPLSVLNEWRRGVILKLLETRAKNYPRIPAEHKKTNHPYPEKELDYSFNIANSLAKSFYERHGAKVAEMAFELQENARGKKVMTTKHCLKYFLGVCQKQGNTYPEQEGQGKADLKEPLYLVYQHKRYRLGFDCKNCQMEIWNN